MIETRNSVVLADFVKYCERHPEDRFWQALRNWSGRGFILACDLSGNIECREKDTGHTDVATDTFYWEGKDR